MVITQILYTKALRIAIHQVYHNAQTNSVALQLTAN